MEKIYWVNFIKTDRGYDMQSASCHYIKDNYERLYIKSYVLNNEVVYKLVHGFKIITESFDKKSLKQIASDIVNCKV